MAVGGVVFLFDMQVLAVCFYSVGVDGGLGGGCPVVEGGEVVVVAVDGVLGEVGEVWGLFCAGTLLVKGGEGVGECGVPEVGEGCLWGYVLLGGGYYGVHGLVLLAIVLPVWFWLTNVILHA